MLLGVYLHAAFAYAAPSQSIWLATDPRGSRVIDASIWALHLFRMPVFFLLSGYFAQRLIDRKGLKSFLAQRALRIALPMVLFYFPLLAAMSLVIGFGMAYPAEPLGIMGEIVKAAKDPATSGKTAPWTTMHLWFLYYLLAFSFIAAGLHAIGNWARQHRPIDRQRSRLSRLARVLDHLPIAARVVIAPLLLLPGASMAGTPLPAPESFRPVAWPLLFYGTYFAVGWCWALRKGDLSRWQSSLVPILVISALMMLAYLWAMPRLDLATLIGSGESIGRGGPWLQAILTSYLSASLTLVSLLLGERFLARESAWLRFLADASYWTYLVHLPIVLFLQTLLIPLDVPAAAKLIIVALVTMIGCLATYVTFVRYTPLGWLLHGKRSFP
jgi:glucans biosynthesis protein C